MAHWFKKLFGESGDKTAIPETDATGNVNYTDGFTQYYSLPYGTDPLAKTIDREIINQAFYDVTGAIQQYQTHGFPDYIDATTNGGTAYAYAIGAVVRWTDNKNYRNTVAGNTDAPNVSGWVPYNDPADAINSATSKTTPADDDELPIVDSASSNVLKKLTWANLKTALNSVYVALDGTNVFTGTNTFSSSNLKVKSTDTTHLVTFSNTGTADKTLDANIITRLQQGTAVASTSGTYIDFTSIPSWAKRITVFLEGVSTSGTSPIMVQLGSSGLKTSGYLGTANGTFDATPTGLNHSSGFLFSKVTVATYLLNGAMTITNKSGNSWVETSTISSSTTSGIAIGSGSVPMSGSVDTVRVTMLNRTDTFKDGSINVMWEG